MHLVYLQKSYMLKTSETAADNLLHKNTKQVLYRDLMPIVLTKFA